MGSYDYIPDITLRRKLEAVEREHKKGQETAKADLVATPARYAFSRSTPERHPGAEVKVRNTLDEQPRGGVVVEPVGMAYRVQVGDNVLVVHEPDDTWG